MINLIYCHVPQSFFCFFCYLFLTLTPVIDKHVVQCSFSLQTRKKRLLFAYSVVGVSVFLVEQGETWN